MKKYFIALAVAALSLGLMGCTGDDNNANDVTPPAVVEETPPPAPPAQATEPTEDEEDDRDWPTVDQTPYPIGASVRIHEPVDLGGAVIRVGAFWGYGLPYAAYDGEEPDPATADNYFIERLVWDNAMRVRSEFNIDMQAIDVDQAYAMATLTSSVMAGDAFADLVFLGGGGQLSAIVGDLIHPLSTIDLPGSDILGPQVYGRMVNEPFDGEWWAFLYRGIDQHARLMGVNLDVINALGLPNPVDLYNSGQWTWDNALHIMREATRDTTGDGLVDQWGIAGQPADIFNAFIAANDGPLVDAELNYAFDHPNTVEALEFLETIFTEGLWETDPNQPPDGGDWGRNFFAFHDGNSALFSAVLWGMNGGDLPFEFAVVPFPTGPSNTAGYTWGSGWGGGFVIPHSGSIEPRDLIMVADEFFSWPGDEPDLMDEGNLETSRQVWLTEDDLWRQVAAAETVRMDVGNTVPEFYWILGYFADHFIHQTMTVQQAIEAYRAPQQELLNSFFR